MAMTAAELQVVVGWDDSEMQRGAKQSSNHLGGAAKGIGIAAAAAGAVAVGAIGAIGAATVSMQDALMPVGTLLGTNTAKFAEMSEAIKGVVKNSPVSAKDVGASAYQILSAGITDTKDATAALEASIKLSMAGLGSAEEATGLVTSAMNSFKTEGLSADATAKILFGTIQSGKTTTGELAQGFGQVAPMASVVGIKFEELMSATAAMTSLGSPASTVFAQMRAAMQAILSPTKDASEAAEKYGIDLSQAHMKAVGFPAFLREVKEATGGDAAKMGEMFSGEALGAMVSLTTVAKDAFESNITNLVASGQTLDERAKQVGETLSNRFKTMKNHLLVAASDVGDKVVKAGFAWWKDHGPAVTAVMKDVQGGITAMFAAFKAGGSDVTSSGFAGVMERVGLAVRVVFDGAKAMFAAFKAGNGDVTSSGFAGTMEKIGNAARSVYDWIKENWPKIKEAFSSAVNWIATEIVPRYVFYMNMVKDVVGGVIAFFIEKWPQIKPVLEQAWVAIQSILATGLALFDATVVTLKKIWKDWGDEIMAVVNFAFDHILPFIELAFKYIGDVFAVFKALLKGDWGALWEGLKTVVKDLWDGIKLVIGTAIDAVVALVKGIGPAVGRVAAGAFDSVKDAFASAINWIIDRWNNISFTIPNPFGADWNIGTPNIPRLASGGTVLDAGYAMVGEMGPERLFLPQGARVEPLGAGGGGGGGGGGGVMNITVNMPAGSSGEDVVRALRSYQRRNGSIPITVRG